MSKRILLVLFSVICLFSFSIYNLYSQKISGGGINFAAKLDSLPKTIVDYEQHRVYYQFLVQPDPEDAVVKKESICMLQLGKGNYLKFLDYFSWRHDSIHEAVFRTEKTAIEYMALSSPVYKKIEFPDHILFNLKTDSLLYQPDFYKKGEYTEAIPKMEWTLLEGDSVFLNVNCKKARTSFRGRDYTVWYAPSIAMPYGPYKFAGLPGLIFSVYDDSRHYVFNLIGIQEITEESPIYYYPKRKELKREELMQMYRNYCKDPLSFIMAGTEYYIEGGEKKRPSDPYNPIELE